MSDSDFDYKKVYKDLRTILKPLKVLVTGGRAIDANLPIEAKIYTEESDNDYDCFSQNPYTDAMKIVDAFLKLGYTQVTAKTGYMEHIIHIRIQKHKIADLLYVHPFVFERLWKRRVLKEGVAYSDPVFLKMRLYYELSRPKDDPTRIPKVIERTKLFEQYYPSSKKVKTRPICQNTTVDIVSLVKGIDGILIGAAGTMVHSYSKSTACFPLEIVVDYPKESYAQLAAEFEGLSGIFYNPNTDLLPQKLEVYKDGGLFITLYSPLSCNSYHILKSGMKVGSLNTLIFFMMQNYFGAEEIYELDTIESLLSILTTKFLKEGRPKLTKLPEDCKGTPITMDALGARYKLEKGKYEKPELNAYYFEHLFFYDPEKTAKYKYLFDREARKIEGIMKSRYKKPIAL